MKTFRILVPTDFSDSALLALEHGIFLAKKFEGELVLLHVAELPTITIHDFPSDLFDLAMVGSVSEKVLRSAHCPVMVVNTGDDSEQWSISA